VDKIGAEVTELTPELAEQMGFKDNASGVLVTKVDSEGPARDAGVARGMLVVKVDKKPVHSVKAFRDAVEKGSLEKGLLFQVQTARGTIGLLVLKAEAVK
jgi:serine protease Do